MRQLYPPLVLVLKGEEPQCVHWPASAHLKQRVITQTLQSTTWLTQNGMLYLVIYLFADITIFTFACIIIYLLAFIVFYLFAYTIFTFAYIIIYLFAY